MSARRVVHFSNTVLRRKNANFPVFANKCSGPEWCKCLPRARRDPTHPNGIWSELTHENILKFLWEIAEAKVFINHIS